MKIHNLEDKKFSNILATARLKGFKTNDMFKDVKNYLEYKKELEKIEIEEKIKLLNKRLEEINYIKNHFSLNSTPLNLNDKNDLKEKYLEKPGVLFIWGLNSIDNKWYCLTGGQTINLYGHIINFQLLSNKTKIKPNYEDNRWFHIANNYNKFNIIITHYCIKNFKTREILELNYAIENSALYWKPSATQLKYFKILDNTKSQKFE